MAEKLSEYESKYDWVKVKANSKHNLGRRKWNGQTNMLIAEGEEVILPRGCADPDEELTGMKFYFKNGFYEVVDPEPELPDAEKKEKVSCTECNREFDSERGMKQHRSQKHSDDEETNKKEEEEG